MIPMAPFLVELDRAMRDANRRQVSDVVNGAGRPFACADCRALVFEGAHSTPLATFCDKCWRWRQAHGCEFDARSKSQIEAAARKGAA